jgi:hypothetical protein
MSNIDQEHLNQRPIAKSLVDETLLPTSQRAHLSRCAGCSAERERGRMEITRMGQLARQQVPGATRKLRLPGEQGRDLSGRWKLFKPALATAFAALTVLMVFWLQLPISSLWTDQRHVASTRAVSDDDLMEAIGALVDNALPRQFQGIANAVDPWKEEDLMEFIVPSIGDRQKVSMQSKRRRLEPC